MPDSTSDEPRYLPHSRSCFVCGETNDVGLKVRFELVDGAVVARCTPGERHTGYRGVVHGGIQSALLDETMGWAPSVRDGRFSVCAELKVRFLRPLPPGTPIVVRGWATRSEGRLFTAEGTVAGEDGTIYARGAGKYSPLTREQTEEVLRYLIFRPDTVPREALWPEADPGGS